MTTKESELKKLCKNCDSPYHYQTFCPNKQRKPISKHGKESKRWETFRDKVAIPFLDKKYGRVCAACKGERCGNKNLDVDHILGRGSHSKLKYDVKNLQYLGRYPCHREKTDRHILIVDEDKFDD